MHLMRIKIFLPLKASRQLLLGLKHFDKISFKMFTGKIGLILLLQHAAFESGYTEEIIPLMHSTCISLERRNIVLSGGMHYFYSNFVNFLRF